MPEYFKCSARITRVTINSDQLYTDPADAEFNQPFWQASAAAFLIPTREYGHCAILVQRSPNTGNAGKWACLPAGGCDNLEELRNPEITVHREGIEELLISWDGRELNPLQFAVLRPMDEIEIYDETTGEITSVTGEIHLSREGQFLFIQAYNLGIPLDEDVIIKDGEIWVDPETGEKTELDRRIAVVPINKLDFEVNEKELDHVQPAAMYKSGKWIESPPTINLSGYQTPTLEWLRRYVKRMKHALLWGGLRG